MSNTNETIADIVAAHEREMSKNASKNGADFGQLGDAAKLREAVQAAINHLENAFSTNDGRVHLSDIVRVRNARVLLAEALAAPPRNCDVHDNSYNGKEGDEK